MTVPPAAQVEIDALCDVFERSDRLLVLTGAGISTDSGIPDYRDDNGDWKRNAPMQFQDFVGSTASRQRYWARSMIGWPRIKAAQPNAAHQLLHRLETAGLLHTVITQNVDRLHQRAGSQNVIDLHGRLDQVICIEHGHVQDRETYQDTLKVTNPDWTHLRAATAPDGDADLDGMDFGTFQVAPCPDCGAVVKPRVVFYGESVPAAITQQANDERDAADALLVIGSSLMVFSGYRFARTMAATGRPVAMLNRGRSRADDLIGLKVEADIAATLRTVADRLLG